MNDYLDQCRIINSAYYAGELRQLRKETHERDEGN